MSGYIGHSMSRNAASAYGRGLLPASKIGHGIPAKLVKKHCRSAEWHHTSSKFNSTEFYDLEMVLSVFGISETEDYPFEDYRSQAAVDDLTEYRNPNSEIIIKTGIVSWTEWGRGRFGKPCPIPMSAHGKVTYKKGASMATVTLDGDGRTFRKKLDNIEICEDRPGTGR